MAKKTDKKPYATIRPVCKIIKTCPELTEELLTLLADHGYLIQEELHSSHFPQDDRTYVMNVIFKSNES